MKYLIIAVLFIPSLFATSSHDEVYLDKQKQIECLAKNLYHEARGEGKKGMMAVATVTLNRVRSKGFPGDVCMVVYQPYQFSWTIKDKNKKVGKSFQVAYNIAQEAIIEDKKHELLDRHNALFYHTHAVNPSWNKQLKLITVIGKHKFYAKPKTKHPRNQRRNVAV